MQSPTLSSVILAVITTVTVTQASENRGVSPPAFSPDKKIPYKTVEGAPLRLHVFFPGGERPASKRPAIVFFFGGGWVGGSPEQFYPHCAHYADLGLVAIAAEYRTESQHGTSPKACVADGKSAIRWIRGNSADLGVAPNTIVAGGGSAGGHVAAATASVDGFNDPSDNLSISPVPQALVLFNPVFDNSPGEYGHDRVKEYWRDFSPLQNVDSKMPPTVVFFGTKDKLVTVDTAKRFEAVMKKHGRVCQLHLYDGQPHGFFNYRGGENPYYTKTVASADRFLRRIGIFDLTSSSDAEEASDQ